jgi:hypothetical protein
MNERIKELAIEATEYNEQTLTGWLNPEKFAELIIRKCIQEIENQSMNSNDEWEYGLRMAQGAIQEHFGVEE